MNDACSLVVVLGLDTPGHRDLSGLCMRDHDEVWRAMALLLAALVLASLLSGCCTSVNAWHAAPWEYGYTPEED